MDTSVYPDSYSQRIRTSETERWKKLESILFEDRLQNLLLSPRVGSARLRRSSRAISTHVGTGGSWLNGARLTVVTTVPVANSSTAHHVIIGDLLHFTYYKFRIIACHLPHDMQGHTLGKDFSSQSQVSPAVMVPWCSTPAEVSHRTKPCLECDLIRKDSLRATTSLTKCGLLPSYSSRSCDEPGATDIDHTRNRPNRTTQSASWFNRIELSWIEPDEPNGQIRFYWVRYRPLSNADSISRKTETTVPAAHNPDWTLVCSLSTRDHQPVSSDSTRVRVTGSRASVVLVNLMPGLYEFQVMSVSWAGNSSWSDTHQFLVRSLSAQIAVDFFSAHFYLPVLFCLLLIGTLVVFWRTILRRHLKQ
ncbi:hypothetical protein FGIG_05900 [Fasciola gigantica]|uniref:Fibronectin type-III domain-containing protein n=1 Tax=Fasciola gigantica TaxID=46835 RepID=A0A504YRB4_FASGI|nr:hypothetical protein FGIG_05900 [Fasciola gigantica]